MIHTAETLARTILLTGSLVASLIAQDPGEQKQESKTPSLAGPTSVEEQIKIDKEARNNYRFDVFDRALEPYHGFKKQIKEEHGLSFGLDYSALYLHATESVGKKTGSSGMVRFFGSWDLAGRGTKNTGAFIWKVEHRHRYTEVPASALSFENGYVGMYEPPFSDQGGRVTNLFWRQRFLDGKASAVGGFLDVTDYLDLYGMIHPWLHFMNFAFSTGSAAIPLPNDASLGVAGAAMLTDNIYLIGGFTDTNSDPTEPFKGFETFFDDHEYFSHIEIGWTSSQERIYVDNTHLTLWHVDSREKAATPNGWGFNLSTAHFIDDYWMPFARIGYTDQGGSFLDRSVSIGIGYQPEQKGDLLGVGLNWGRPNRDTYAPLDLDDQFTAEVFYRVQFSPNFAVTPDVQVLIDPALNPGDDMITIFGLRGRLAF